jgi:hypothetical protein
VGGRLGGNGLNIHPSCDWNRGARAGARFPARDARLLLPPHRLLKAGGLSAGHRVRVSAPCGTVTSHRGMMGPFQRKDKGRHKCKQCVFSRALDCQVTTINSGSPRVIGHHTGHHRPGRACQRPVRPPRWVQCKASACAGGLNSRGPPRCSRTHRGAQWSLQHRLLPFRAAAGSVCLALGCQCLCKVR